MGFLVPRRFSLALALVLAGYAAAILILTSRRVRLTRKLLPIAIGTGTLTAVALYAHGPFRPWSPHGWLFFAMLGLPLLTGFAVARLAGRDTPASGISPVGQGGLAGVCATGTAVLLVAALVSVTIAIFPQKVPLFGPTDGTCITCDPDSTVIPPRLRHEYQVGVSIDAATRTSDVALLVALFPATSRPFSSPRSAD